MLTNPSASLRNADIIQYKKRDNAKAAFKKLKY